MVLAQVFKTVIMRKAYIYPISSRASKNLRNPYLENFMASLSQEFVFVNERHPSDMGISDVIKYLGKIDAVFLHWPENIIERKFGFLQTILLTLLLPFFRIRKVLIVYVVHNKVSHSLKNNWIKKFIMRRVVRHSTFLVTHASEGVEFIQTFSGKKKRVFFFPHPIDNPMPLQIANKDIDVLIWGNIAPYKGVHNFLQALEKNPELKRWKIYIAGKVSSGEYYQELIRIKPEDVVLMNEFIGEEQLHELISRSRLVLFPYLQDSILSSGAFAKTLAYPVAIIGPNGGAFKDFSHLEQVDTFELFDEIPALLRKNLETQNENLQWQNENILKQYSWASFGKAFNEYLNQP